jgi:hypothetical protein
MVTHTPMSSLYVTFRKAAFAEAVRLSASLRVHQSLEDSLFLDLAVFGTHWSLD